MAALLCLPLLLLLSACSTAKSRAQARPFRVAYVAIQSPDVGAGLLDDLRTVLNADGWVEGRNYVLDARWASGAVERLPALAAELVQNKPDVIFAGSDSGAVAAHSATSTIPIVSVFCGNPVHSGFVQSLAHPGENVTGVTVGCISGQLHAKDLQLLKETLVGVQRIAVVWDPSLPDTQSVLDEVKETARSLGIQARFLEAQSADDIAVIVADAKAANEPLFVLEDVFVLGHASQFAEAVAQYRLPAMFQQRDFVDSGGLMSYGANLAGMRHMAFGYVKRILEGTRPANLPILQPTSFELVINLKTAQSLGITIPDSVLAQATDVIR